MIVCGLISNLDAITYMWCIWVLHAVWLLVVNPPSNYIMHVSLDGTDGQEVWSFVASCPSGPTLLMFSYLYMLYSCHVLCSLLCLYKCALLKGGNIETTTSLYLSDKSTVAQKPDVHPINFRWWNNIQNCNSQELSFIPVVSRTSCIMLICDCSKKRQRKNRQLSILHVTTELW